MEAAWFVHIDRDPGKHAQLRSCRQKGCLYDRLSCQDIAHQRRSFGMNSPLPSIPGDVVSFDRDVAPAFVAARFGISLDELQRLLGNRPWPRLTYRIVQGTERDGIIRHVLERIDGADLRVVGNNDGTVWERGWGEILDRIRAQGFDPSLLYPQYFDQ